MKKTHIAAAAIALLLASPPAHASTPATPATLRVITYNVGHFNQGKLGGYQNADAAGALKRWRDWFAGQKADILLLQEWNAAFDKDGATNATNALLKPLYRNIHFGPARSQKSPWIYNGIATNLPFTPGGLVELSHPNYYLVLGEVTVAGQKITVGSFHVPWQKDNHAEGIRLLVAELKRHKNFIIGGDTNAPDATQRAFAEAGFNIANGAFGKWLPTAAGSVKKGKTTNVSIDQIITSKNIRVESALAPETGLNDNDHLPVVATFSIGQP